MAEDDDLNDLDALLATMPEDTRKHFEYARKLELSTHRALFRMLAMRRWLWGLAGFNVGALAVNLILWWHR